jgi:hypothetical protein
MLHTVQVDEAQRQLIVLALAHLSLKRPGWTFATNEAAQRFPNGAKLHEQFRQIEDDEMALAAERHYRMQLSNVADICAKIAETAQDGGDLPAIVEEIRRYSNDLKGTQPKPAT